MKKLMIALAAAAAITGVAKADIDNHVTNFESLTIGNPFNAVNDDQDTHGDTYWAIEEGATEPYAIVTNASFNGENRAGNALSIDTDKPLSRKVKAGDAGAESFGTAPLYFDGYVQFTAADSLPETEAGDKLVVWLYGGDESTDGDVLTGLSLTEETKVATNLVVTAGTINLETGDVTPTHYLISGLAIEPNSWHRLTIKAVADAGLDLQGVPGFKVWVDSTPVTAGATAVFPSLVKYNDAAAKTLTSVSFKGTGAVDDLGFTNVDLFPEAAAETFTLTVTAEGISGIIVSEDEEGEEVIEGESGSYAVAVGMNKVYVYLPTTEGGITAATFDGDTVVIPSYAYGGYTFELTIPQGTTAGTTLAFVATTSGGQQSEYPTYIDTLPAATKAAYQTKYDAWKGTYSADTTSTHGDQFLLNIAPSATAELETATIVIENGAVKITTSPAANSVNGKVYIKTATTLQGLSEANWAEATLSEGVIQVTPGSGATAGFYKVKVDF